MANWQPDWPVVLEGMRTGDCVCAVYEHTDKDGDPFIGLGTWDHVMEGLYLRYTIRIQNATFGSQALPQATDRSKANPQQYPFSAWGISAGFFPKGQIKRVSFLDPVTWEPYLRAKHK